MFGGYRKFRKEKKKPDAKSPPGSPIYVALAARKAENDSRYTELPADLRTLLTGPDESTGDTEQATDDESEISFEEMLQREKSLEMKMKNRA